MIPEEYHLEKKLDLIWQLYEVDVTLIKSNCQEKVEQHGYADGSNIYVASNDNKILMVLHPECVTVGVVAHESKHVVDRVMNYIGEELDSETSAYLIEYVFKQALVFYEGLIEEL